ncbi:MAG: methionine synthase [Planctomycetes bacterium]|nr:methionine synthase [Planctomycetota bacterium]
MTKTDPGRIAALREALATRVLVLDGAMGTQIHAANLDLERDYDGHENCVDVVSATRPEVIQRIHETYLEAGADLVETNTFGAMPHVLSEFGIAQRARELNRVAASVARAACAKVGTSSKPRFALGSMGPGTKLATLGHASYEALKSSYAEQARGLIEGGVDGFLIETCQDPLQIKAAVNGVLRAREEFETDAPIFVSVTMEVTGTMLVGTEMGAAIALLDPYPIEVLSINCATGPREMGEHVRLLGQTCRKKIMVYPNAGLPQLVDGKPFYPLTPAELADWLMRFVDEDGMNVVGGCCGTTPAHIAAVAKRLGVRAPRPRKPAHAPSVTSLYSAVTLRQDNSILFVGARSTANGSKAFREHLLKGDVEAMVAMGREQVREGSHVLDLCAAYVGRDEVDDMTKVVTRYRADVPVPLMVDSTEPPVIRRALELIGGRSIVNSINLEDGLERIQHVLPIVKEHGAAVIALTIDEQGMAKTAEDKLRIARRIYQVCVEDWGLRPEDLLFDVLTFTICTGNEDDRKLALETLKGIELVRRELPGVGLLLGVSNVSFGLNPAARHVLNSVFLHHATEAGLTAAILHAARIEPLHRIDPKAREVAEDLIFDRRREGYDPLQVYLQLFQGVDVKKKAARVVPADVFERLRWRIVEGEKPGLEDDLAIALKTKKPLEVINVDLLAGMKTVGELFGRGDMQLPFVLQSAETMKAAVAYLEPFMEKSAGDSRGKIVLATVRGDVHDIGKNLVDIILTNNGYTVFNLGIKQPIQHILDVAHDVRPDAIGMSGLLVKSTVIMRENLEEMNRRGVTTPVILGGAALTRAYVEDDCRRVYASSLYYAEDAFEGLAVMARIVGGETKPAARDTKSASGQAAIRDAEEVVASQRREHAAARRAAAVAETPPEPARTAGAEPRTPEHEHGADDRALPMLHGKRVSYASKAWSKSTDVPRDIEYPDPPFLGPRLIEKIPLQSVLPYVNETTLFQFQWGYRRKGKALAPYKQFIKDTVRPLYFELAKRCDKERIVDCQAAYGYWRCVPEGDTLVLLDPKDESRVAARFAFPRQLAKQGRCITDYFHVREGKPDVVALQVVTIGQRASDVAREWFTANKYQDYLHLHGFGVEVAEGLAEYVHRQIRGELGLADADAREMSVLFKQGYRGSRFSFGYPACPRLEDQGPLLELLGAEKLGITLSEEFQLHPEQSTSAIVCHHPSAKYFTL